MAKADLYKISGHWDHYMDGMFILNKDDEDKETMALRPMTCPFQYYVYMNEQHSYRDLPYRMSETSTLFRNEDSGEMYGLTGRGRIDQMYRTGSLCHEDPGH